MIYKNKKRVCMHLDTDIVNKGQEYALNTYRTFSGVVELALEQLFEKEKEIK